MCHLPKKGHELYFDRKKVHLHPNYPPPPRIHSKPNPDQPQNVMDCCLARDTPPVNVSIFHSFEAVIADAISSLNCMKNNIIYERWTYSRIMYFDWEKLDLLPLIPQICWSDQL